MKHVKIIRLSDTGELTVGNCQIFDESGNVLFTCNTLERPWKQNQHKISCIPAGEYHCKWSLMVSHNIEHYLIENVPNRDGIFIHIASLVSQLLGCVSLGEWDGYLFFNSRKRVAEFETILQKEDFTLTISNEGLSQAVA